MKTVKLNLGPRSYNIYIGKGIIGELPSLIKLDAPSAPIFIVTNRKICNLYADKLENALKPFGKKILFYEVPDSEKAKSFPIYIRTIRRLARFARKTRPLVCAFGGGVIGDLAGFVASAYRRGVPYIQIPTTLLAQVDSAIGGKVAIDIKEAKNIVGNFYQPKIVMCDLQFLKTLPDKELRNGLVEIIKYGIIEDEGLFSFLEKNIDRILRLDTKSMEHIIFRSCAIKAKVVEKDELDTKGMRNMLNFGHTLGHAIEAASCYSRSITHGQAVAIGIIMASRIALEMNLIAKNDYEKICLFIQKISPERSLKNIKQKDILNALSYDKKFIYGENRFILPRKIGFVEIIDGIPRALIKKVVETYL
ncbi:MAG: 3-dehydroquinate synthase [Omnitrophica bacterium RBG_13_46_9]|nr:MAG: 3-dehydroquinate synthase [Omnitrophica bacterium RBG_13_46_9]